MKRNKQSKNNTAQIKDIVTENLKRMEKVYLSDIIDIIRPFYTFKKDDLIESELRRKARYIMGCFRDGNNIRIFFSDSGGAYINIEKSSDLVDLSKVNSQLSRKYAGISGALAKVQKRIKKMVSKFKYNKK